MKKTVEIDLSSDRLVCIAADMIDDHNYIGALKMLNKNAELSGNDEDAYMLYAEAFDDMGLYEKCINGWFKFLDCADTQNPSDLSECYEGLAVSFMNVGNRHFSAYYYNKLLMESDEIDPAAREDIVREFLGVEENPLKIAYPPEEADCSGIISDGIGHIKEGELDKAIAEFDKVDERNKSYLTARNYVAMCKIIADRTEEAEQECENILKKFPDDVQALTTLAAVKSEAGKSEEALDLAKRLLAADVKDTDELYKIATVCCENKLHEDAYKIFCRITDKTLDYDLSMLYFKAVAAFNCGRYEESFDIFDTLLTVYPDAVTANYYYLEAREMHEKQAEKELSYIYRMPQDQRESSLTMLAAFMRLPPSSALKVCDELDITECVLWCFDELEAKQGTELKSLATQAAIRARLDDIVRDILLDAFLPDELKIEALTSLAERNEENAFGVVICNIYKRISMRKLNVGRLKRAGFVRAYARLVAHFSILDDENGEKFAAAAEKLYAQMAEDGRLDASKDASALSAAIYILSGVREMGVTEVTAAPFFGASEEKIKKITGEVDK